MGGSFYLDDKDAIPFEDFVVTLMGHPISKIQKTIIIYIEAHKRMNIPVYNYFSDISHDTGYTYSHISRVFTELISSGLVVSEVCKGEKKYKGRWELCELHIPKNLFKILSEVKR